MKGILGFFPTWRKKNQNNTTTTNNSNVCRKLWFIGSKSINIFINSIAFQENLITGQQSIPAMNSPYYTTNKLLSVSCQYHSYF